VIRARRFRSASLPSVALLLGCVLPGALAAQSSQFGFRGVGLPTRPIGVRAMSTGGSFGMFDPQSSLDPAALGALDATTASFNGLQEYRSTTNPAGSESQRETRFPQVTLGGPIKKTPLVLGLSYSAYSNRDFSIASAGTATLRGVPVPVNDTLNSRGGISSIRLAAAYRLGGKTFVGAAFHILTGSDRVEQHRSFSDTTYRPVAERSELSYAAVGVSVGLTQQVGSRMLVALAARSDGHANIDKDSTRIGRLDLPYSFAAGVRYRVGRRLDLGAQGQYATWSGANSDLSAGDPPGFNTIDLSFGGEYTPDPRRPGRHPIRFGARYGTLPFPIVAGAQPHELGFSVGTGARFAKDRAGVDVSVEHVSRSDGTGRSERAFLIGLGITIRP
jgi:hypothetical protein